MWFTNKGQILQTVIAGAALLFVVLRDWPTKDQFLSLGSLIVLSVAAFFGISLVRTIYSLTRSDAPKTEALKIEKAPPVAPIQAAVKVEPPSPPKTKDKEFETKVAYDKVTVKIGAKERLQQSSEFSHLGRDYQVELIEIHPYEHKGSSLVRAGRYAAELQFDLGGGVGSMGTYVKEISTNRFLVPVATEYVNSEDLQVFNFGANETHIYFFSVRVEHINPHEKTASLVVTDLRASKYRTM